MTITSIHNPGLKDLRRLARRRERERSGKFVAEGEDLIAAADAAEYRPVHGYRVAGSQAGGAQFTEVEPAALSAVSVLGSGTRVIGVYEQRWEIPVGPLCVYLHGVADPGNVGAVLRSALAFGASCVALGPGCADPYSPKAVRASMGAIFTVALARAQEISQLPGQRLALVTTKSETLCGPADGPVTLLIGGERLGLPKDVLDECDRAVHIPIASQSLNAAMAATVALYEMTRGPFRVSSS
jgi:RNA methyltransferase, TrmH family